METKYLLTKDQIKLLKKASSVTFYIEGLISYIYVRNTGKLHGRTVEIGEKIPVCYSLTDWGGDSRMLEDDHSESFRLIHTFSDCSGDLMIRSLFSNLKEGDSLHLKVTRDKYGTTSKYKGRNDGVITDDLHLMISRGVNRDNMVNFIGRYLLASESTTLERSRYRLATYQLNEPKWEDISSED